MPHRVCCRVATRQTAIGLTKEKVVRLNLFRHISHMLYTGRGSCITRYRRPASHGNGLTGCGFLGVEASIGDERR